MGPGAETPRLFPVSGGAGGTLSEAETGLVRAATVSGGHYIALAFGPKFLRQHIM